MESIVNRSTFFEGPHDDIWDRVATLAPSSPPVAVRLFRRPPVNRPEPVPEPMEQPALQPKEAAVGKTQWKKVNWERLKIAAPDILVRRSAEGLAAPSDRSGPVTQAFDLLRTRLLQTLKANDWSRVAIAAPSPGCGSTFAACNLAVSLSRMSACRTVLLDLNFRAPGVARRFGLRAEGDLRRYLVGQFPLTEGLVRYSDNLAVGLTEACATASAELLHDPRTERTLDALQGSLQPDVILCDLPPMLGYDDVAAFLPRVDGVLLIADGTRTVARQIAECERMIAGHTKLLGVVLNRSRDADGSDLRYANV